VAPEKRRQKMVLLVSNVNVLAEEVIDHGINLSSRLDGGLEIVHLLQPRDAEMAAERFHLMAARRAFGPGVAYRQLVGEGDFRQMAVRYASKRRNVLCVILCPRDGALEAPGGKGHRKFQEVTQLLSCPVVLYGDPAGFP
jgi:hypothetical protein